MPSVETPADHLVIFGITGDLAHKMTLPSLYRLERRNLLTCPVTGVAFDDWSLDQLRKVARDAITAALAADGESLDEAVFGRMVGKLDYLHGDFTDADLYHRLQEHLVEAHHPMFYLEIPPSLFGPVVEHLGGVGLTSHARVVVEKPFGTSLGTARELNERLSAVLDEEQLFRIDHFLGKEPVQDLTYLRFGNSIFEPLWRRQYVDSIQVTMGETFGVEDRGSFYDKVGAMRDVVQNHLLQVIALVLMEPPGGGVDPVGENRLDVFEAMRQVEVSRVIRGQYTGYQGIKGVSPGSDTETFVALRLEVDNWRWAGVPIYVRAGKMMPVTATEVVVRMKRVPRVRIGDKLVQPPGDNDIVLRVGADAGVDIGVRLKTPGLDVSEPEMLSIDFAEALGQPPTPYERLLHDALVGDHSLFPRWPVVEATWQVVQPILDQPPAVLPYEPGTWGPAEADALARAHGGWHTPRAPKHVGAPQ